MLIIINLQNNSNKSINYVSVCKHRAVYMGCHLSHHLSQHGMSLMSFSIDVFTALENE